MDGMERFACPTPDVQGRYRCIDDHVLCDGFIDCPEGEDEDRRSCMFYKTVCSFHFFYFLGIKILLQIILKFLWQDMVRNLKMSLAYYECLCCRNITGQDN